MVFRLSYKVLRKYMDFPSGSRGKESTSNAENTEGNGLVPGSGRSPGVGNGNPLQYPCLENHGPQATVHNFTKSWT